MGILETYQEQYDRDKEEIQALRDELNRVKGEQGKPDIRPNKDKSRDISSEKERNSNPPKERKGRRARNYKVPITRSQKCYFPREELPPDAVPKGFRRVIIQDIKVVLDNAELLLEVFYSPSTKKTYMAARPPGCEGEYGDGVRTFILTAKHMGNMSESCIHDLLKSYGILISKSSISRISRRDAALFHCEADDILKAGVLAGKYVHIDDTGARVDGKQHFTQILCNPFFTAYMTLPHKDRLSILRMLLMGIELKFQFNDATFELLEIFKVPEKVRTYLKENYDGRTLTEQEIEILLKEIPSDNRNPDQLYRRIMEAAGITWYHEQKEVPVVQTLVSDDAAQFRHIADFHSLCWIHAGRIIKKLNPLTPLFQEEVSRVRKDFWIYYKTLLTFQQEPEHGDIEDLREQFDKIFTRKTDFPALDKILHTIFDNKEKLLVVLKFPHVPLNNNPAELGARVAVRKRDVSLHTMTPEGTKAVDTSMTIIQTAKKLEVNPITYIHDRLTHNELERLAVTLLKKVGLPT
ncbi:MAG: transposase [Methanoregula sp.]|nr:transposase [Methanoregula sp.]